MTTGPSSGHSESWYWLQSSHPATDVAHRGDSVQEGDESRNQGPPPHRAIPVCETHTQ